MSAHCHFQEHRMQNLRQIQKQMRLLDLRLQMLRDRLCAARHHRCALCCCMHPPRCPGRRALSARQDLERRLDRTRRLGMMLSSSCSQNNLSLIDVKGFDPKEITVVVKDGKVTVAAERKEEHNTCMGKISSYKKYMKEFSLPPGVSEKEVTYSVESNNIVEPPKCCPYLCNC
ncbi:outer dense fiber protein 1 [Parus major]|uniref:outer dense fiber protein 1 n=1 Tax=Parus major TaxID=9157 RepID=UPI00077129BF|nr:outer dense fiber protein 1 [Parus major]XP_015475728.1 outer dense fiber protein 1 [Parus major]